MGMQAERSVLLPLFLAPFLILLLPDALAAEEALQTVTVTIETGPYEVRSVDRHHEVTLEGFGRLLVPGKPELPARIFAVAIPPGAEISSVTFDAGEAVVLPGAYAIPPAPLPRVLGDEDPALHERERREYEANYQAVYGSDAPYPASAGEFIRPAGYRKYNLADVRIAPFTYHPRSGRLVYHPRVSVHVHYTLPDGAPPDGLLQDRLHRTETIAREIVCNYDQAQSWYPGGSALGGRGLHDYVIITLPSLTAKVQALVDWETAKGRTVEVVTTDWIDANYTGYDLAEKMRNFLRAQLGPWGIEDVCLVGHYGDVPMRLCSQNTGYGKPETDYYYAELSKADSSSWDKDQDHNWGENTDPIDFYAEVNVGRIPWSEPDTVEHICVKSVGYEKNHEADFKRNMLLLGAYFWADTDNAVLMEYKTNPSLHPWMADWTLTRMYEKNKDYSSSYPCDHELLNSNVMQVWPKDKFAFVNWAGHGSPTSCHIYGLGAPAFISSGNCPGLDDNYPSIIFADACSNSDTHFLNIGQAMLKDGAVGFLGATRVAYGMPGWDHPSDGSSQSLDYHFTTSVTSGDYTQGAAHQWSLRQMYTLGLWYQVRYEMFEWGALWGNPDLKLEYAPKLVLDVVEGPLAGVHPPGPELRLVLGIQPALENYVPGTAFLHYRYHDSDPFSETALTPLGGDLYEAVVAGAKPGDTPQYYFTADGDGGTTVCLPSNAPADVFTLDICLKEIAMEDDFEHDLGWKVWNIAVDDGAWERGDPAGTAAQPEDDHSPAGTQCFVTGKGGGAADDHDLDGGPSYLMSPPIDLSNGDGVISFYIWFHHSASGKQQPLLISVANNGLSWVKVKWEYHNPQWKKIAFKVSNFVTPTSTVQVQFRAWDNPDDSTVEALVDDFRVERLNYQPTLWADGYALSVSTGAVIDFFLGAGAAEAGRSYLLLGSLSGSFPGLPLPGGAVLPIKWDAFTGIIMGGLGSPVFDGFMGTLDAAGEATATLNTFGPVDPILVGAKMYFAYLLSPNPFFASNAVIVEMEP